MYLVVKPAEVKYYDRCKECGQETGLKRRATYGEVVALVDEKETLKVVLGEIGANLKVFEFPGTEVDLEELFFG